MVACDNWNMGCNGGNLFLAWKLFIWNNGIVSDSCYPYTAGDGVVETCRKSCVTPPGEPWRKYKCSSLVNPSGADAIRSEVQANGPVETGFTVYEDFMSYKSGIYHHTTGDQLGGHAVKIVGFGQEEGVNYWICQNSWGTSWGEEGFFRIQEGDCGIDSSAYACIPKL